jgi:hypothetical protein
MGSSNDFGCLDSTVQVTGHNGIYPFLRQPPCHLPGLSPTPLVQFPLCLPLHNLQGIINGFPVSY